MPQFLTRNETTLPNNFTTINTTDNVLMNSSSSTNSYFQFVTYDLYGSKNQFYIGLLGGNLRNYSATNIDMYSQGLLNASLTPTNWDVFLPQRLTNIANTVNLGITNSNGSFNSSLIQANSSIAASGSFKYFCGKAAGVEKVAIFGSGDIQNTNNSYGALSDIRLKENIEPIRDYERRFYENTI